MVKTKVKYCSYYFKKRKIQFKIVIDYELIVNVTEQFFMF